VVIYYISIFEKQNTMITGDCIKDGSGILFAASLAAKRYSGQPGPLFLRGMPKNYNKLSYLTFSKK